MNPAIGYRVWRVEEMLTGPRLVSPFRESAWLPGAALQAECKTEVSSGELPRAHRHQPDVLPPVEACSCGIYAYHDMERMLNGISAGLVGGAVVCWGRITIHPEGIRSQFARPLALCFPDLMLSPHSAAALVRLAASYNLPLLESANLTIYTSEFGESYKPVSEAPAPRSRVERSVRSLFGRLFSA